MKKVGIITLYYNNANYGALLQSYALQKVINNLGNNSKQISYDLLSGYSNNYSHSKFLIKNFIKKYIPGYNFKHARYNKKLNEFEKSIQHTSYVDSDSISKLNEQFDVFVCGSDQIWNPIGWQANFFLYFSKKPKISYAASIARDTLSEEELDYINKYTNDFVSLSVREKINSDFLTEKLNREYRLVPDPTLLLTRQEWDERFPNKNSLHKPFIFAYFLGFNEEQRNDCIEFAKKQNLDIYFIPYMKKESFVWDKEHERYMVTDCRIENFINLIRNAELVLTDSFHGTVFSCIYEKSFYVLNRQLVGYEKSMNSRIDTLFYELNVDKDRMITDILNINDYTLTEKSLEEIKMAKEKWRKIGLDFLKESFEKVENDD